MIMAAAEWMVSMGRRSEQIIGLQGAFTQEQDYFENLPLSHIQSDADTSSPWWDEWISHPTYDDYRRLCGYEDFWPQMTVPALNITGWWDMNFLGAPRNFIGMRRQGATQEVREGQLLVIGPWPHWVNQSQALSGVDFGPNAVTDLDTYTLRFFDYWVRGAKDNGLSDSARVHIFVMGANEWWEADDWPLAGTQQTKFYFHSEGGANTHHGDGRLSQDKPGNEPFDQYVSDPLDPVRVPWNMHEGPLDDRPFSARPDVLCYTSEILEEPLNVVGPVMAITPGSRLSTLHNGQPPWL
jgi:putative CocE/NonD family hydrolase